MSERTTITVDEKAISELKLKIQQLDQEYEERLSNLLKDNIKNLIKVSKGETK